MLCQNCKQNEATIHLYANVNGQRKQLDYCQNCYQRLKAQANNNQPTMGPQDPFGFGSLDDLYRSLSHQMQQGGIPNEPQTPPTQSGGNNNNFNNGQPPRNNGNENDGMLGEYGFNITEAARQGNIDPVVGRDQEIQRVIEVLNRRTKNNPVLIGEPGVGKTAVVEGLAQKIINGDVPQKLLGKEVIRLDVVSLVQGTGIRGQFEERMQNLIDEVTQSENIILFIDEVHEIVGAGTAGEGNLDAGNILKPALARGDLQMVGATTLNEYRVIEKDAALERRLQPVRVDEPTINETIKILKGLQKRYEAYHHVKYTDDAIEAAASLSNRYIQDRFLPDKAIDLLDESGSKMNLTIHVADPKTIENRLTEAEQQKQKASAEEDFEKAAYYRDQINKLQAMKNQQVSDEKAPTIDEKVIEGIVEERTGIPVGELKEKEKTQLKNLSDDLRAHVIGQDDAVDRVAKAIRRNRVGLGKQNRPIGSFLFVGPTGVGKTELARQLAYELFGSDNSMIRFDMSEYMEKHSVSRLIGSPPGYVGYEEAGQLTEQIRRNPYSLVLLDEVEKAHPDVLHVFLQILDDGRLTDAQGRTVSFKDTIIIMTSNAGSGKIEANVGFGAAREGITRSVLGQLNNFFTPEFLNRFDGIIEFKSLDKKDLLTIVSLMLDDVNCSLEHQKLNITIPKNVKEKLVDLGYNPAMGARPLRRIVQEQIEDGIAEYYLEYPDVQELEAKLDKDKNIVITKKESKAKKATADLKNSTNNQTDETKS
ncbi:ATP-dependent Clp protease ATP-binding subunit [Melissococcus plutonius]|uniref:ATP-dependent Clp protease, ATP-binding subunit ClpE n=1 Tax=Melissococcus plutonius (strain ATCC 35311 / DSM 29964 / CIP 104052 / LMG 20360 / NCIMB 702443) TaxID=940190 RepID=F3Y9E0_MELPT|nr:ATP-dependent Clp protease ATP-binding subunit [Melissococcus plutonius]AIM24678.1 ATP-dependent Clp protease ATP-binding subunit ClpE [Melissococcus plutonius S1]KMT24780.1 ATP-dependent Clp protease ATP-binding subunit ClpE [Melissococcus plutonius]KMT26417.1 ATP-dependent Clp protease ATP-binding subunit ClpE [Melissococcus plutonius]KMT27667.1 ATP-dependent Clp protease ATP-binding subunit ClpE [Melissococcus plutonius]KMT29439.1 ATP-dependent Clp protease ATP-binding subunit ClpE [Meli